MLMILQNKDFTVVNDELKAALGLHLAEAFHNIFK